VSTSSTSNSYAKVDKNIFEPGKETLYRRFAVRERARIQEFPENCNI